MFIVKSFLNNGNIDVYASAGAVTRNNLCGGAGSEDYGSYSGEVQFYQRLADPDKATRVEIALGTGPWAAHRVTVETEGGRRIEDFRSDDPACTPAGTDVVGS